MDSTTKRREARKEIVAKFLSDTGLSIDLLASATQKHLDDWARQVQLITDQPSTNWDNAILHLSKAVESELATSMGRLKGLEFLKRDEMLGKKATKLREMQWHSATKRLVVSKAVSVSAALPDLLLSLAGLRAESAHGRVESRSATAREGQQARSLTGRILKNIISSTKVER